MRNEKKTQRFSNENLLSDVRISKFRQRTNIKNMKKMMTNAFFTFYINLKKKKRNKNC